MTPLETARHYAEIGHGAHPGMAACPECSLKTQDGHKPGCGMEAMVRALEDAEWQYDIGSAPQDGTLFLATLQVFVNDSFSHHDMHVICADDMGEIPPEYEQGWRLEDYEAWRPLPAPPSLPAEDGVNRTDTSMNGDLSVYREGQP